MLSSTIQVIFFDLGDTLVRIRLEILRKICEIIGRIRRRPLAIDEYMTAFIDEWSNRDIRNIKDVMTHEQELIYWQGFFQSLLKKLGLSYNHRFLIEGLANAYSNSNSFECFEDVHIVLTELKLRGYKLGLISNAFPSAVKIINDLQLKDYFEYPPVLSFQLPERSIKPEPEIYNIAIEKANVEIGNTLFVDDRWPFVKAAMEVGMNACLIERFSDQNRKLATKSFVPRIYNLYELRDEIVRRSKETKHTSSSSNRKQGDGNNLSKIMSASMLATS